MAVVKGIGALDSLNTTPQSDKKSADFTKIASGESVKVRVKGFADLAGYFNYGIFGKVKSFVPEKQATRDANGYVVSDHTPWDLAEKHYRDLQFKEIRAKNKAEADKLGESARLYKGTEKYLTGFFDLTTGEDIVVDMTKKQALTVHQSLKEYCELDGDGNIIPNADHDFHEMAFKLTKVGEGTSTSFTLSPIIKLDKGLTEDERKNFDESAGKPFDSDLFDGVLFEASYDEQVTNLQIAGFDLSLIGLSASKPAENNVEDDAKPLDDNGGKPIDISDDDLPF